MARTLPKVDLEALSAALKEARERKGWTLQQLAHELWAAGFPTSQNKLWRMENNPPSRVDTELVMWLEKILGIDLISEPDHKQVLVDDVILLIDEFVDACRKGHAFPEEPAARPGQRVHQRLADLVRAAAESEGTQAASSGRRKAE